MCLNGTLDCLLQNGRAAGVSRFLVHSVAISADRVEHINTFLMQAAARHPQELVGFGSLHPNYADLPRELERMRKGGLRGVKLHPDFQKFLLDDAKAIEMFRAMADAGMPALVHTGDKRYEYSQPERMARVLDKAPKLKVICAHLGGWSVWTQAWHALAGRPNLWVDTSSSLYAIHADEAAEVIRRYGADRVFFGTDYPMWRPKDEIDRVLALPLTPEEREKIFHLNFEAFLRGLD